jgi:CheY-like chemotaxis protein
MLIESNFDLYALLDDLEEMFRLRAEHKGLRLVFKRAPNVPRYIRTDERKLRQVIINLLSNAIKFTDQGSVTLWVRPSPISKTGAQTIEFKVQDTGAGIAPDEMDKLFELFTQTTSGRKAQEGTGLGLFISRQFAQLMGGDIAVSSRVGQGTIFTFDLQVQLATAAEIEARRPTRRVIGLAPEQPAYRILIVDDNLESRILLRKLLEEVGFIVQEAVNGKEAIEQHQSWQPHLVWMDLRMPAMDGYEATRQIKTAATDQATVVIALTASSFEEQRAVAFAAGCDDFVRKPFQESSIFDKMAQHLGVRYIYEEPASLAALAGGAPAPTPQDLAALPADWIAALHQAAIRGKTRQALDLIDKIQPEHTALAESLAEWVRGFRFDKLAALMEQAAKH